MGTDVKRLNGLKTVVIVVVVVVVVGSEVTESISILFFEVFSGIFILVLVLYSFNFEISKSI